MGRLHSPISTIQPSRTKVKFKFTFEISLYGYRIPAACEVGEAESFVRRGVARRAGQRETATGFHGDVFGRIAAARVARVPF